MDEECRRYLEIRNHLWLDLLTSCLTPLSGHSPTYVVSSTESRTFAPKALGSVMKLYTSSVTFHLGGNILVEGWSASTTVKICWEPSERQGRPRAKDVNTDVRRAVDPDGSRRGLLLYGCRMRCWLRQHLHCGLWKNLIVSKASIGRRMVDLLPMKLPPLLRYDWNAAFPSSSRTVFYGSISRVQSGGWTRL